MPRNSSGIYSLPVGNPVKPGTVIESVWANTTMTDIAAAITGSLPRDGSSPMLAPLTLSTDPITDPLHAASKEYVDNFLAFATGLPVGAFITFGGPNPPSPAFILCNGQAISRTAYPDLFTSFGTIYGAGDGVTTFNVPDAQKMFFRGRMAGQQLGLKVPGSIQSHTHPLSDPGHNHTAAQPAHSHSATQPAHNHTLSDPGHRHTMPDVGNPGTGSPGAGAPFVSSTTSELTNSSTTGITLGSANPAITVGTANPAITVNSHATGISIGAAGSAETAPDHILVDVYVKAVKDALGPTPVFSITTSDADMISVDNTDPSSPELVIHSNVAFGTVKLDASGKIPINQLPSTVTNLLGYFDASSGQNPTQKFPLQDFASGDTYIVSVAGTILVINPVTNVSAMTLVDVGWVLQYVENSPTNPTGWYYTSSAAVIAASQVTFAPSGTISSTNVQDAIEEVANDAAATDIRKLDKIDNYSLLRSYINSNTSLYVLGRTNDQDGASDIFTVDESDVTSLDDDGFVIVDTLNRRWKRQGARAVSVKYFGAVGDGVTNNDLPIIQAVIKAQALNMPVDWPAGTYLTTLPISALHYVEHTGTGVIKRGSQLFHPNPSAAESNILFVAPPGILTSSFVYTEISATLDSSEHPFNAGIVRRLTPTTNNTFHHFALNHTVASSTVFNISLLIKSAGYDSLEIQYNDPAALYRAFLYVDLSPKTFTTANSGGLIVSNAKLVDVNGGWFLISATLTFPVAITQLNNRNYIRNASNVISFAGDGVSAILVSQSQVALGSTVSGLMANDGLSSAEPMATLQQAFAALTARGDVIGSWEIRHAAGTYSGEASTARLGPANENEALPNVDTYAHNGINLLNTLVISGPDVGYDPATNPRPIPTALYDGGSAAAVALQLNGYIKALVKNIKYSDYSGSASSAGVSASVCCWVRTENVHTARCNYGISALNHCRLEVKGGSLFGDPSKLYTAIRALFQTKIEIGNQLAGATGQGPLISFCSVGMLIQESSTGHADFVSFEDNNDALRVTVNSRTNCSGSDFKRNTRAIRADGNAHVFYSTANFFTGTADANTENLVFQTGGINFGADRDTYSNMGVAADYKTAPTTVTGTTTSTPVFTRVLKGGEYMPTTSSVRKPIHLKMEGWGSVTGTAGTKQIKVRLGATTLGSVNINATETGSFHFAWSGVIYGPANQAGNIRVFTHLAASARIGNGVATESMVTDKTVAAEVQLTNAADSVTVDFAFLEIWGG